MPLIKWIPAGRLIGLSLTSPSFLLACAPAAVLCCLGLSKRWARWTDTPAVFALVYGLPFFLLTFQDSLGDSLQILDEIGRRYYMSEPVATWIHYWFFRLLHEPFNIGAKTAVALSSRLAGVAYLWVVARTSRRLFPDLSASRRLVYRLLFFTPGVALLFYGYVENTPLALPAEELWVLASIAFLERPGSARLCASGAALALATAIHGRAAFLAPAFILQCWIPTARLRTRLQRVLLGGAVYFGLLAVMVTGIMVFDAQGIYGNVYGNALGGGNGRMFEPLADLLVPGHWVSLLQTLLVAGGVLAPCGLIAAVAGVAKRRPLLLWAAAYLLADLVFLGFWEFDYGLLVDWDLVFSGICPLLLLAGIFLARSRVPVIALLPFLLGNVVLSMAFAAVVNNGPLTVNLPFRAGAPASDDPCTASALRRTFFSDPQLTVPLGPSEADIPDHAYEPDVMPFPRRGQPFGGVFKGYLRIPASGRYRFFILGQGDLRLRIADQVLFDRWTGFEWRVASEREMWFPQAGWYPIRFEFFSTTTDYMLRLTVESARHERRLLTSDELCHDGAAE